MNRLECEVPLGMENGAISDGQISASTQAINHLAIQGRLHFKANGAMAGCWSAVNSDVNQWLQVDLSNRFANVTGVATQGRNAHSEWVTKYNLQYSDDGLNLVYYTEKGLDVKQVR